MIDSVVFRFEGAYSIFTFTYYVPSCEQSERVEFASTFVSFENMELAWKAISEFKKLNNID